MGTPTADDAEPYESDTEPDAWAVSQEPNTLVVREDEETQEDEHLGEATKKADDAGEETKSLDAGFDAQRKEPIEKELKRKEPIEKELKAGPRWQ